jgi:murein DD-endopeptidase MepM/ murein hydrolase activator NlpD
MIILSFPHRCVLVAQILLLFVLSLFVLCSHGACKQQVDSGGGLPRASDQQGPAGAAPSEGFGSDPGGAANDLSKYPQRGGSSGAGSGSLAGQARREFFPTPLEQGYCDTAGKGVGAFRANRAGGRLHAACDIYIAAGTPVHAVADGTVLSNGYPFYCSTDAVEVDHGTFVARYGEIRPHSATVQKGQKIKAGQVLAKTGLLDCYDQPMLHFEMYSGTATGSLTGNGGAYSRRSDLINPTGWLKARISKKPN